MKICMWCGEDHTINTSEKCAEYNKKMNKLSKIYEVWEILAILEHIGIKAFDDFEIYYEALRKNLKYTPKRKKWGKKHEK